MALLKLYLNWMTGHVFIRRSALRVARFVSADLLRPKTITCHGTLLWDLKAWCTVEAKIFNKKLNIKKELGCCSEVQCKVSTVFPQCLMLWDAMSFAGAGPFCPKSMHHVSGYLHISSRFYLLTSFNVHMLIWVQMHSFACTFEMFLVIIFLVVQNWWISA